MKYVGFSEYYHDAGFAIIDESGNVDFATHSERYSKKKNDPRINSEIWKRVCEEDHISFYEDHSLKFDVRGGLGTSNYRPENNKYFDISYLHHQSHCATAFYTRPWDSVDNTVQVSIDGVGELQTACILDKDFNLIKEWHYPKSVGLIYTLVTTFLGLRPLEDEYVVMGLSSYGEDKFSNWIIEQYKNFSDTADEVSMGILVGDPEKSDREKQRINFRDVLKQKVESNSREDAAASCQAFAEWAIMDIMQEARKHGSKLVYSGGCAQNVIINSLLPKIFDEVHIAVSPTDAGSALGCAAISWAKETGKNKLIWTPYSGYNIDRKINPTKIVDHLIEKKVCGIANGKAEFGPRALGNRSLIADVRYDVKDTVNNIKRRQMYRPFAPAILEEYAEEYFFGCTNEYMQYTSIALHDYKSVTHIDGTARVQVVKKDCNSIFRKIIEEYYERTGVPMLLNTSLNIRGRPMVNDENDAKLWQQQYNVKVF